MNRSYSPSLATLRRRAWRGTCGAHRWIRFTRLEHGCPFVWRKGFRHRLHGIFGRHIVERANQQVYGERTLVN